MRYLPFSYPHSAAQMAEVLRVDSEGQLWWKQPGKGRQVKIPVGCLTTDGFLQFTYQYYTYRVHIVAWALYHGKWPDPDKVVTHLDGNKLNNRRDNLALMSFSTIRRRAEIRSNKNRTGYKGVRYHKGSDNYDARISVDNKTIYLGIFKTAEEAHAAVQVEEQKLFSQECA